MKTFSFCEPPMRLYGLCHIDTKNGDYWRLSPEILGLMPQYEQLGRRAAGGRVRFRTNSPEITLRMTLKTEKVDRAMALPAAAGADVYAGTGASSRFIGYVAPAEYGYRGQTIEGTLAKGPGTETVTVNLPRNEAISSLEILLEDGASAEPPDDYAIGTPIVFYGSSITEGGCAPRPGNAYTSIVSRLLDADYYNFGFSGGAKGEPEFARFIAALPAMSAFVYDYDHNAPDTAHLARTHRPFFEIIRAAHPSVPVVMLSRPDFDWLPDVSTARRAVIYDTYQSAQRSGDKNVYFIDGQTLFGFSGREECTVDGCHPNALGFMRMAEIVHSSLKRVIGSASL